MSEQSFDYLLEQYITGRATKPEKSAFFALLDQPKYIEMLERIIQEDWETGRFEEQGNQEIGELIERYVGRKIKGKSPVRRLWIRGAAAAAVLILLASGYFLFFNKGSKQSELAGTQEERFKNDVNPGGFKARLQLADGSFITLDSAGVGELTKQGGTLVINKNGQLVYQSGNNTNEVLYNTLFTAKGETYTTILADGSKVWLNSASSIRFPVAFKGAERRVEITGEAYFEVKHNDVMPFIVSVNGMEVHDLGTSFNINAYSDEPDIKTTLVEGSARVIKGTSNQLLSPGQQVQLDAAGNMKFIQRADVDEAVAWKNGRFSFKSTDIKTLMRQLNRWYDIEVSFESIPATGFNAKISRETPLSSILKALELTGEVKFRIEGKKVVVMR